MWNHFDIVEDFKYICEEREISLNLFPPFFGIIFLSGRIHFVNTITAFRHSALQLYIYMYIYVYGRESF